MPYFDVCNGDADGLCAVVQWRLAKPQSATLVTGLKRDIALLDRVVAKAGDQLLVCDISMRRNLSALLGLLACGAEVSYFDHHEAGTVPSHPRLHVHVTTATTTCTSLLVSEHLGHPYRHWALVGAYGDQLDSVADALAAAWGVPATRQQQLRTLGQAINHNAYGDSDADVCIAPARLYDILIRYPDPLALLQQEPLAQVLIDRQAADLKLAMTQPPYLSSGRARAYLLPDAAWSRRVGGSLVNALAALRPHCAHAVLRRTQSGGYLVSVRAPHLQAQGAAELCRRFGGSGRAAAAGIDDLPACDLRRFLEAFVEHHWERPPVRTETRVTDAAVWA